MIQLNDFRREYADIGKDLSKAVDDVLASGYYILGDSVRQFETALADYWGMNWTVGCANGMDAIEIGLRVLGLKPGDKVLTTPLSAFATTLAIIRAGGQPVFADTDSNGLLDLYLAEQLLKKDPSIRFMVPVHLYGIPMDLGRLQQLQQRYDLKIVEDCAQAIGAAYDQQSVGSVGAMATVSFYPTKNLGAIGDGGALLGNDAAHQKLAAAYRNYGQSDRYVHDYIGLNSRLDEVQAAMLTYILKHKLNEYTQRRQEIASMYLTDISHPQITLPHVDAASKPVWHLFPIFIQGGRQQFVNYCLHQGVQTGIHYPVLIPDQQAMKGLEYQVMGDLAQAAFIADHEVSLPIHPYMTDEEIVEVVRVIHSYTSG
jgi:dTDP-4-amino-4,6-dideoxygalactose transaminase